VQIEIRLFREEKFSCFGQNIITGKAMFKKDERTCPQLSKSAPYLTINKALKSLSVWHVRMLACL